MWLLLALLCACTNPPASAAADRGLLVEALHLRRAAPDAAIARCRDIRGAQLRGDCVAAVVEAAPSHADARGWCAALPAGLQRDECFFQRAEGVADLEGCVDAGAFAADCRVHVWSAEVRARWPGNAPFAEQIAWMEARAHTLPVDAAELEHTFAPALFRNAHEHGVLDLARCDGVAPAYRDACRLAARSLLDERLNRARDTGALPCGDDAWPPALELVPGADAEALREAGRRDRCEQLRRRDPPGARMPR